MRKLLNITVNFVDEEGFKGRKSFEVIVGDVRDDRTFRVNVVRRIHEEIAPQHDEPQPAQDKYSLKSFNRVESKEGFLHGTFAFTFWNVDYHAFVVGMGDWEANDDYAPLTDDDRRERQDEIESHQTPFVEPREY